VGCLVASGSPTNDRWFFIQLYRWLRSILKVLTIIRPETLKSGPFTSMTTAARTNGQRRTAPNASVLLETAPATLKSKWPTDIFWVVFQLEPQAFTGRVKTWKSNTCESLRMNSRQGAIGTPHQKEITNAMQYLSSTISKHALVGKLLRHRNQPSERLPAFPPVKSG
jgi:hypothetical protein